MANAVSPTAGGIMASVGGILAFGLDAVTGDTERGAAVTVLIGGACYIAAGLVAATMRKDLLGPDRTLWQPGRVRPRAARAARASGRGRAGPCAWCTTQPSATTPS